jgi:hypothetical protein
MTLTLLFSLQYLSESCFGDDNDFFITHTLELVLFSFTKLTFNSLKILFTQHFFLRCHPDLEKVFNVPRILNLPFSNVPQLYWL